MKLFRLKFRLLVVAIVISSCNSYKTNQIINKGFDIIKEEGDSLVFIPHKYTKEPVLEFSQRDIRFKVIWSYKLVYEVTNEHVVILDIIHTSRDPQLLKSVK